MNSTEFSGKVALVTGASSGIGAATASLLAERGAAVAVFGRRKDKLDDVVARIREAGGSGLAVPGDVGVPSDVERAVAAAVAEFGALHYGVNNAGMSGYFETVADLSLEKWNEVVTVNLRVPALRRPSYITGAHLAVDGGFLA
jgi:NAD(P)-dependent dehydrogenase (short-subunit alcohol dehydrogenase family)